MAEIRFSLLLLWNYPEETRNKDNSNNETSICTEFNILKNQYDKGKTESVEELNIYNQSILTNSDWLEFKASFEVSYPKYIKKVLHNFASMTEAELRLFLFIKMHLSTKDISAILGISPDSVKKTRHRLRKRINLNEQQSLEEFVGNF